MKSQPCFKQVTAFTLAFFLFFQQELRAQFISESPSIYGFNLGLNLGLGSHFQRLGVNLHFYYCFDFIQSNSEIRLYRNFKNLGPRGFYDEIVLSQGIVFGYGEKTSTVNPFVQSISNQTAYKNSIAYAYNAYFNKIKTSQQTGSLAFQVNDFYLITENDILARPQLDRYRTGAFLLMYQYQNKYQFAVNCSMWTGEMGNRVNLNDSADFSRCYMDTSGGRYTNYSHGLLSLQFKSYLDYGQNVQVNVGADAEKVRQVVQNKIIHDMCFLPKKWRPLKNCAIPMLDTQGQQYLYKKDQEIKKPSLYWNGFMNANVFY